ncbi:MAG: hypothetical protein QOF21_1226 [Actinomycetota bacterium]
MLHREQAGSRPAGRADLGVDVLDVVARRFWRDNELLRDGFVRESARDESQDLDFARGESGNVLAALRHAVAGRHQHCADGVAVEATSLYFGPQFRGRVIGGAGLAKRSWFAHRLVHVGGGEHPRRS